MPHLVTTLQRKTEVVKTNLSSRSALIMAPQRGLNWCRRWSGHDASLRVGARPTAGTAQPNRLCGVSRFVPVHDSQAIVRFGTRHSAGYDDLGIGGIASP